MKFPRNAIVKISDFDGTFGSGVLDAYPVNSLFEVDHDRYQSMDGTNPCENNDAGVHVGDSIIITRTDPFLRGEYYIAISSNAGMIAIHKTCVKLVKEIKKKK